MATISAGGSNGHHTFYLNTSESNVDTANNRSTVNWNFQITGSGWDFYDIGSTIVITINGTQVYNVYAQRSYSGSGTTTWASGSIVVPHNTDGSKTVSISFSYSQSSSSSYAPGNASASGNMALTKINRYAVTNSVTGSDIEQDFSVSYTKYISSYQYKLRISIPSVRVLETIDYNTSGETFTLSQETIEDLFSTYTTTNTFTLGFAVETWNSAGTSRLSYGNEKQISCSILNANPIFNNYDFNDINATTLALTGNSKYNINGYSTIRVTISVANKAEAQKGASMVKYRFIIGDTTREVNYSDEEEVSIDIENSSIGTYQVYAIDSRNNSTLVTKLSLQNIEYTPLYLDRTNSYTERDDGGIGENVSLIYNGNIWNGNFGSANNSITLARYEYKEKDSNTWIDYESFIQEGITPTDITPTITDNTFNFNNLIRSIATRYIFDVSKSYNFRITLEDELSSTTIELTPLSSGIPNISLNKNGVGIMCNYDESLGGLLQVGGEVYNNNKVVAEYEVTGTNENTITLENLNLEKDKTYLFKIVGSATTNSDIHWRFNDITASTYYSEGFYATSQGTTSDANMSLVAGYRPRKTYFYYGLHMTTNYSIIEGKIMLYPNLSNGNYYPSMKWSARNLWEGYQNFSEVFGVLGTAVNEINKIYLALASGYFREGTKIQIVEENKYTII